VQGNETLNMSRELYRKCRVGEVVTLSIQLHTLHFHRHGPKHREKDANNAFHESRDSLHDEVIDSFRQSYNSTRSIPNDCT